MKLFFVIVSFISISSLESQHIPLKVISEQEIDYPLKDTLEDKDVFTVCFFPEEPLVDIEKWTTYLNDSFVLDDVSLDTIPAGTYTVIVHFSIGEKGRLNNVSILKEPGYGLGERVRKAISNCYGIWKPVLGKNGLVILSYRKQPITFIVGKSCEELPGSFML